MLQRFAAGSAVASLGIAVAALAVLLVPAMGPQRFYPLLTLWCFLPAVWGLWSILAPKAWVPHRFPWWGAILGSAVGLLAFFVLNLPSRIFGEPVSAAQRGLLFLILVVLYYLLWMLVRVVYRSLASPRQAG